MLWFSTIAVPLSLLEDLFQCGRSRETQVVTTSLVELRNDVSRDHRCSCTTRVFRATIYIAKLFRVRLQIVEFVLLWPYLVVNELIAVTPNPAMRSNALCSRIFVMFIEPVRSPFRPLSPRERNKAAALYMLWGRHAGQFQERCNVEV